MVITYQGHECFKLQFGDLTVVTNPPSKDSVFKTSRFGADVVLQTIQHQDMNGGKDFSYGEKEPFVISGPGEYETRGVFIRGFPSVSKYLNGDTDGGEELINTIYTLQIDGINICFLGALGSIDLKPETVEGIDGVDILFVPVGGKGVLGAADAYKIGVTLEAKLIIPMHYEADSLKAFLKEAGESVTPTDKLTIKKKDLEGKEGDVVVLSKV